ncbi:hypothetical protein HYT51_03175 [Candidatus Woesearchaeota archaeon]|nr:hypothetical protein [Candidatus Woesearchaeota archaeon]
MAEEAYYKKYEGKPVRITEHNSTSIGVVFQAGYDLILLKPTIIPVPNAFNFPIYRLEDSMPTTIDTRSVQEVDPLVEGDLEEFLKTAEKELELRRREHALRIKEIEKKEKDGVTP